MPVTSAHNSAKEDSVVVGRIGFVGRLDDPRKNVRLLLEALKICRDRGLEISGLLVGASPEGHLRRAIDSLGLAGCVQLAPVTAHSELADYLATVDVFVIPSAQEGLCIAGLEAMAAGCPVVSTRCGGPEEFVVDAETGFLTGFDAVEMADRIEEIVRDRALRRRISEGARRLIAERYSPEASENEFWRAFEQAFPDAV